MKGKSLGGTTGKVLADILGAGGLSLWDILGQIDAGVIAVDLEGQIVYWNPAAKEKFGFRPDDKLLGPIQSLGKWFRATLADGKVLPFEDWPIARVLKGERVRNEEIHIARIDGSWSAFHRYSGTFLRDRGGEPLLALLTIKDISDRSRLEEQLRYRVDELETLMDVAPVGLFVSNDPHCDHMVGNRTANEYYNSECGTNLSANETAEFQPPARRFFRDGRKVDFADLPMQEAVARNTPVSDVELDVEQGGQRFTMFGSATPLHDDQGRVRGCVGAFLDITERRRTEAELKRTLAASQHQRFELEAANRELEAFSYSISHDLQGPLRAINGFSTVLLEDFAEALGEEGLVYLDRIQSATVRMSALLDGLLSLSRISRSELNLEEVDLGELARDITDELRESAPHRNVDLSIESPLASVGDRAQLRVLLENLFTNAWKYTATVARAKVEFFRQTIDGRDVFAVRDNGIGFDMAEAEMLFHPFERVHSDPAFQGTGIGLATVRRIVQRHGGSVWAEGRPKRGATIYFALS